MRMGGRPVLAPHARPLNVGVVVAVLLASLATGLVGGVIVWALWRYGLPDPAHDPRLP
jgi:hypothetical protein